MQDVPIASWLGVVIAVLGTLAVLWRYRTNGPSSVAQLVTSSTMLIDQLQHRITALETRVEALEAENDAYRALHGPLPPPIPPQGKRVTP